MLSSVLSDTIILLSSSSAPMHACVRACVRACVLVCVCACVRACTIRRLVRDLRAIYRPFFQLLPKARKLAHIMSTIAYCFDFCRAPRVAPPRGRHFENNQNGRRFSPIVYDTTFQIFFGSGNPILTLFL